MPDVELDNVPDADCSPTNSIVLQPEDATLVKQRSDRLKTASL